jgi:uncharacterized protein VirK/YbjX
MTPKDKAQELIHKFSKPIDGLHKYPMCYETSEQCAKIAIDELIEATKKYVAIREKVEYSKTGYDNVVHIQYDEFWQEVKNEIQKF